MRAIQYTMAQARWGAMSTSSSAMATAHGAASLAAYAADPP